MGDSGEQNIYNSFLLLGLMLTQILLSLSSVDDLIRAAASDYHNQEVLLKQSQSSDGMLHLNDKKILDRKHDQIAKKIA